MDTPTASCATASSAPSGMAAASSWREAVMPMAPRCNRPRLRQARPADAPRPMRQPDAVRSCPCARLLNEGSGPQLLPAGKEISIGKPGLCIVTRPGAGSSIAKHTVRAPASLQSGCSGAPAPPSARFSPHPALRGPGTTGLAGAPAPGRGCGAYCTLRLISFMVATSSTRRSRCRHSMSASRFRPAHS